MGKLQKKWVLKGETKYTQLKMHSYAATVSKAIQPFHRASLKTCQGIHLLFNTQLTLQGNNETCSATCFSEQRLNTSKNPAQLNIGNFSDHGLDFDGKENRASQCEWFAYQQISDCDERQGPVKDLHSQINKLLDERECLF